MATGVSVTDSNDTLICPACLDTFQDPRILPCGHSLCGPNSDEKCIIKLETQDGSITCPTCRKTHNMKATDAAVSFALANLLAEMKSKRMCEQHSQEILYYCEADDQEICMTCWQVDHVAKNHKVVPISVNADRNLLKKWKELDSELLETCSTETNEQISRIKGTLERLQERETEYRDLLLEIKGKDSKDQCAKKLEAFFELKQRKPHEDEIDWQLLLDQVGPRMTPVASESSGSGGDQFHVSSTYQKVKPSVPTWNAMRIKSSTELWKNATPIFSPTKNSVYVQTTLSSFTRYSYDLKDHSFKSQEVYQFAKPISCIALGPESSIYVSFNSQKTDVCQCFRHTGHIVTIDVSKALGPVERLISFPSKNILLLETYQKWFVFKDNKFIKIVTSNRGSFVNQESGPDYGFFAEVGNNDRWILQRFSFMELEQPVEDPDKECTISMYPITETNCSRFCCLDSSMFTSEKRRLITLTSKSKTHSTTQDYMETRILELSVFETNKFFLDVECIGKSEVGLGPLCPDTFYLSQFLSMSDESAQVLAFEYGQMHIAELFK